MPASNASGAFFAPLQRYEKRRLHQTWNPGGCGSCSCCVHRWTKRLFLLLCLFRSTYHSFLIANPCLKEATLIWSSLIGLSQSNIWNYVKDYRRPFRNCNDGVIPRGFFRRVGMVRGLSFFLQKVEYLDTSIKFPFNHFHNSTKIIDTCFQPPLHPDSQFNCESGIRIRSRVYCPDILRYQGTNLMWLRHHVTW